MKKIVSLGMLLALGACATLVQGTHQDVKLSSSGPGECTLVDKKGITYTTKVPGNVTVNRGDGPLKVTCTVNGQNGAKTVEETVDPWFAGNILLGGLIGITIDSYNGAYQHYPDEINISIVNLPQATAAGQAGAAPIMTPDVKAAPNAH